MAVSSDLDAPDHPGAPDTRAEGGHNRAIAAALPLSELPPTYPS